jgi:hypothetical protein
VYISLDSKLNLMCVLCVCACAQEDVRAIWAAEVQEAVSMHPMTLQWGRSLGTYLPLTAKREKT